MLKTTVEVKNLKPVLKELKEYQPEVFKALRKEMRTEVQPLVQKIKSAIPRTAPLSGIGRQKDRLAWDATDPQKIGINTSTSMKGKYQAEILVLTERSAAVSRVDWAGMRGNSTAPHKKFSENLTRKTGKKAQRYGWRVTMQNLDLVYEISRRIIDRVNQETNRKIISKTQGV
jgi:hypothetical protein